MLAVMLKCMIESKFIEISKKYGGKYDLSNFKVNETLGSKLPISIHKLKLSHKEISINVCYEFGNSNVAEVKFEIYVQIEVPYFELETRDHFSRLFSLKKNPWKIKSSNNQLSSNIIRYLNTVSLTKMANDESFEPVMKGIYKNGKYNFNTRFYLGFNNKENSISPIIEFHKTLIDHIKEKYCS